MEKLKNVKKYNALKNCLVPNFQPFSDHVNLVSSTLSSYSSPSSLFCSKLIGPGNGINHFSK